MKKTVFFEQIIAGAILKFKTITNVDIVILANLLIQKGYNIEDYEIDDCKKYNDSCTRKVILDNDSNLDDYILINDKSIRLFDWLLEIQGNDLKNFFDSLDLKIFTLKKVKYFGYVSCDLVNYLFSEIQTNELIDLIKKGYLMVSWNNDIPHEDFKQITLTKSGKVQLFKFDHFDKLNEFKKELIKLNYDVNLIEKFLEKQDLQLLTNEILSLENFTYYCNKFDRNPYVKTIF